MQHLVYLHGFLSSPKSIKALHTLNYAARIYPWLQVHTPQMPGDISKAMTCVDALIRTLPKGQFGFVGSSMGGFLSTYFVEKYGGRAVLVNPAVRPHTLLRNYLGSHINPYTKETFTVHVDNLKILENAYVDNLKDPNQYQVFLQSGDETLDYKEALERYNKANIILEHGGNHSFVGFENHLPSIFRFLFMH